jgi:hypothetical protein
MAGVLMLARKSLGLKTARGNLAMSVESPHSIRFSWSWHEQGLPFVDL